MTSMAMQDFGSALYLGWHHPGYSLGDWPGLTLGQPMARAELAGSRWLARQLASLQGCAAATLGSSTLHLFWDLFAVLYRPRQLILLDDATYPVIRWGVERAAGMGVPVESFPAHDVAALEQLLKQSYPRGYRALIVSDGFAPSLGKSAPLLRYHTLAGQYDARVVIDDTQALGLFGAPDLESSNSLSRPGSPGGVDGVDGAACGSPWGRGGGGSLQAQQVFGPRLIVAASLAKAFGAPLAVLSGSQALIRHFEAHAQTRQHASGPNMAALRAAQQALRMNRKQGERQRAYLWQLLCYWWQGIARLGLRSHGGPFPAQTLASDQALDWMALHRYLQQRGIEPVLQPVLQPVSKSILQPVSERCQLSFVLTAEHRFSQIEALLHHIATWLAQSGAGKPARTGIVTEMAVRTALRTAAKTAAKTAARTTATMPTFWEAV